MNELSYSRIKEAQRIYSELQEMTEKVYIVDAVIAHLQSPAFFALVILFMVFQLVKRFIKK